MKQIKSPAVSHATLCDDKVKERKTTDTGLCNIQKDRSFLPLSAAKPVAKCGCT